MDPVVNPITEKNTHKWARTWPNVLYPRFEKWYTNSTWLSPDTTRNILFSARAGENWTQVEYTRRHHAVDNSTSRTVVGSFYPAWPYEKLLGTDAANDSIVGVDHMHLPLELYRDLHIWALANFDSTELDSATAIAAIRCLAWKHTFTFGNNSKHTMIVAYRAVPDHGIGATAASLDPTLPQDIRAMGFQFLYVPGVEDSGDRTRRRSFTLTQNMAKDFPDFYASNSTYNDTWYGVNEALFTPWVPVRLPGTAIANPLARVPPTLFTPSTGPAGSDVKDYVMSTPVEMYVKYLCPVNVGVTSNGSGSTSGELDGNGFSVHVSSAWKMEWVARTSGHDGDYPVTSGARAKAYPSQAA